jgi:hypothetical protein
MPKENIYLEAPKIRRNDKSKPVYNNDGIDIECNGLHVTLKKTFFPWKKWKTRPKYGSSKKKGRSIHRQLQHFYGCVKKNKCECGLKKYKPSKYLYPIIKFFNDNYITIDDTEVPIYNPEAKVITWIDAIGHFNYSPESLVKISLKTGYSEHFKRDNQGLSFDKIDVPCSTSNIHHLQSLCEDIILKRYYSTKPNKSFTLYVYDQPKDDGTTEIVCKESDYPTWCREIKVQNTIADAIKNNAKAVLESDMYSIEPCKMPEESCL